MFIFYVTLCIYSWTYRIAKFENALQTSYPSCHKMNDLGYIWRLFVCFSWRYDPLWLYFPQPRSGLQPPHFRGF